MADSLNRAWALLDLHRYKEAQQVAQEELSQNPENVLAYLIISQAALQLDKPTEALTSANQAIGLAPDKAVCFIARARAHLTLQKYKLARNDCQQALQLDPYNSTTFGILAWAFASEGRWREALQSAEQGLQLDPEETNCVNARARALMYLKQGARAFETIESALARDPGDAFTHTNAGWAKLQAGDREAALNHFTEALRREPNMEYAREGLIAAMKAKSPIYGALLSYSFFMSSLRPGMQIAVLISAFIVYQITWRTLMAKGFMALAGIIICLWLGLVVLTWAGDAIFNLLLLFNSSGRQILSTSQKWISLAVASTMTLGFSCIMSFFLLNEPNPLFFIGVGFLLTCLPLAYAGRLTGRKQLITLGFAAVSALLLIASATLHFMGVEKEKVINVRDLAIYSLVAFSWIGPTVLKRTP